MSESEKLRQFWTSKSVIEGNNYDYSQGDSCLRSHSSRYLALKEQNAQFLSSFEQIFSLIENEDELREKIVQLPFFQTILALDRETWNVRSRCALGFHCRFSSAELSEVADRRHSRSAERRRRRRGENLEQILDVSRRDAAEPKFVLECTDENRRFPGDDRRTEFDENAILVPFGNLDKKEKERNDDRHLL